MFFLRNAVPTTGDRIRLSLRLLSPSCPSCQHGRHPLDYHNSQRSDTFRQIDCCFALIETGRECRFINMRKLILGTCVLLRWRTSCTMFITRGINPPQYCATRGFALAPVNQRHMSNAACLVRRIHRIHPCARSVADRQCSLFMNAAEYYRASPIDERYQSLAIIRSGCLPKLVLKDARLPDMALSLSLLAVGCESCQMLTVERRLLTRFLDADTPRKPLWQT